MRPTNLKPTILLIFALSCTLVNKAQTHGVAFTSSFGYSNHGRIYHELAYTYESNRFLFSTGFSIGPQFEYNRREFYKNTDKIEFKGIRTGVQWCVTNPDKRVNFVLQNDLYFNAYRVIGASVEPSRFNPNFELDHQKIKIVGNMISPGVRWSIGNHIQSSLLMGAAPIYYWNYSQLNNGEKYSEKGLYWDVLIKLQLGYQF